MQKKILVIALCLLAVVFLTVACNKNKEQDNDYVPIDYTTDEAGEKYVTNIYGDLIPVTTSKDGGVELPDDLYTKTLEQVEKEKAEIQKEEQQTPNEPAGGEDKPNDNPNDNPNDKPQDNPQNPNGGIQVGNKDVSERDAVIVW